MELMASPHNEAAKGVAVLYPQIIANKSKTTYFITELIFLLFIKGI